MNSSLKGRIEAVIQRARAVSARSSPPPWDASDSGYVSDSDGFVVCHLTARRGAQRWDWEKNPNATFIAQARELVPEMSSLLEELLEEVLDDDEPSKI